MLTKIKFLRIYNENLQKQVPFFKRGVGGGLRSWIRLWTNRSNKYIRVGIRIRISLQCPLLSKTLTLLEDLSDTTVTTEVPYQRVYSTCIKQSKSCSKATSRRLYFAFFHSYSVFSI